MAFLDNSGDIILDAVLTDTGRLRLAQGDGSFKIAKFAIADDEIKALAWLLLTARTAGEPLTMSKLQKISGRSRQSIGRVVKAYAPYFEEPNL